MVCDGRRKRWILVFLGALGLWLGGMAAAEAGTFPVLGPETFTRSNGKPVTVTRNFAVAAPAATTYTLRIANGGVNGELGRVTSAEVKLNGSQIFGPGSFGQNVQTLAKPVTLTPSNVLTVELRGSPGSGFSLRIEGTDNQAPIITATAAPPPNGAGWNRSNVTVTFTCSDVLSGIQTCPVPATVSSDGAGQVVSGTAVDRAGNSASASVTVNLDKTAPVLAITAPTDGGTVTDPAIQVQGTIGEPLSGVTALSCNGSPAVIAGSGSGFSCGLTLATGPNTIAIQASDVAGNTAAASVTVTLAEPPHPPPAVPLEVHIGQPRDGLITRAGRVTVSGTLSRPGATVLINGVAATVQDTAFSAEVDLVEGTNRLVATAEGQGATATAAVTVRRDTHPPLIVIETPRNGDRLVDGLVTVSGTVNDIIPGATVNADDVTLTINGYSAAVNNRTFSLPDVPLAPGLNTLEAEAVDRAGNVRRTSIQVSREPDLAGIRVRIVSGNDQQAPILHDLPEPLVVRLEAPDGTPLPDRPVEFTVSKGDGLLGDPALKLRKFTLLTDVGGIAMVHFRAGSRTGVGFHRVRATTPGSLTFADFCATALPGEATRIAIARMPPVRGIVSQPVPDVLSVIVSDDRGNAIRNVPVTFKVEFGGGGFGNQGASETLQVLTNQDGIADAVFTLGPDAGRANNQISADFPDNPGLPIFFNLSGVAVGPAAETTVSGTVQNIAGAPIVGALAEVEGTGLTAQTGPDGTFVIHNVPPGGHHVKIHGSAASDPDANVFYPDIDFPMEAISGADNPLNQIVTLPFLDMDNAKMVGGDEDVVLEMAGVPGFAIKVFAHSTIHHNGTRGPVLMSSSQVKFDKMPMPPPQGSTPFVVGTLQPGGIHFDPPAQVIYPNVGGLAPGDVADIFAFHHDIGQYVNVGPGTVSEDGTVVASDPGFGFVQSGWHGLIRFPGPTAQAANGCSGRLKWQIIKADGSLGPAMSGSPVVVNPDNPNAKKAKIKVIFSPTGGTFDSQIWTGGGGGLVISRSGDSAAGVIAETTIEAHNPGTVTVTTPIYRIRVPNQADKTCQASVDIESTTVTIDVNLTPDEKDDITLFNPHPFLPTFQQAVQARIRRQGGSRALQLSVEPAGSATLDKTTLNLASGASDTITLTPTGVSTTVNDIHIIARSGGTKVGDEDMTIVQVGLPDKVRRANTPAGMRDRIPPRINTAFSIHVQPDLGSTGQIVTLAVTGQSATNGTIRIQGAATFDVTADQEVNLRGITQTEASAGLGGANAGNLRLVARVRGQDTVQSKGFSVAAIPENYSTAFYADIIGITRGFDVRDGWESDSGMIADLDAVEISEEVEVGPQTGVFAGLGGGSTTGYLPATATLSIDTHEMGVDLITGPGTRRTFQVSKFLDRRTGARDVPMTNSGYIIDRIAFRDATGALMFTTSKFGAAVTANGISSQPAQPISPPISLTQSVP